MNFAVEHHGRKAKKVLAMQLLCDAREGRREVGLIVELEVPPARFFGQPLESRVGLAPHLARSVEIIAAEADRVNHHFFAARLLERSEEHTSELQSQSNLVCRLLLEKKKKKIE